MQKLIPGITPYNYVYNSPLKYVDPDGKLGIEVHLKQGKDGKYTVVSITISDDLAYKKAQYYKNHSLVYENEWHDYMKITIENADGSFSSPRNILGKTRTTINYLPNWKSVAEFFVDDGYFEDGGGVMFTSGDGVGGAARKTKNSVNIVNIDGLLAAMGSTQKLGDMKLPDVDESYLLEFANKFKEIWTTYTDELNKTSQGGKNTDNSDKKILIAELEALMAKYNTTPTLSKEEKVSTQPSAVKLYRGGKPANKERGNGSVIKKSASNDKPDTILYDKPKTTTKSF